MAVGEGKATSDESSADVLIAGMGKATGRSMITGPANRKNTSRM